MKTIFPRSGRPPTHSHKRLEWMQKRWAHRLLDLARGGVKVSPDAIERALRLTGDVT